MATTYRLSTAEIPARDYAIPTLPASRPWRWLRLGWQDLIAEPVTSLTYGLFFALVGFLLTYLLSALGLFYLVPVFTAGFFILAPVLLVGLYSAAKLRSEHHHHDTATVRDILARNMSSISQMGIILLLFFLNWIMLSNLLFGGVFQELMPSWNSVKPLPIMFGESPAFLAVYGGIALVLAAIVFRMTAVAIPMLVDVEVDVFNAIFASWTAVGENPAAMLTWAALIFFLTCVGVLTFYLGLIVILPWLAYATWHAYRDTLVLREDQPPSKTIGPSRPSDDPQSST
jgi:uncharacterized membrane protein